MEVTRKSVNTKDSTLRLPELIELNNYSGNFTSYLNAVYEVFTNDFVRSKPVYRGTLLRLKAHPIIEGREYTFYHLTHSGNNEHERLPDMRRMERIGYPRPIIDNSTHDDLIVWENIRGRSTRILIYHKDARYLVVLEKRKNYILPWTAYLIEHDKRHRRLLEEYDSYIKNQSRPN